MKYHVLFIYFYITNGASPVTQVVKNLTSMWETWVRSLGWEDPLEKEMATHSIILAWIFPRIEEPGGQQSIGLQKSPTQLSMHTHTHTHTHNDFSSVPQLSVFQANGVPSSERG